jgi:hypothetical protein
LNWKVREKEWDHSYWSGSRGQLDRWTDGWSQSRRPLFIRCLPCISHQQVVLDDAARPWSIGSDPPTDPLMDYCPTTSFTSSLHAGLTHTHLFVFVCVCVFYSL